MYFFYFIIYSKCVLGFFGFKKIKNGDFRISLGRYGLLFIYLVVMNKEFLELKLFRVFFFIIFRLWLLYCLFFISLINIFFLGICYMIYIVL